MTEAETNNIKKTLLQPYDESEFPAKKSDYSVPEQYLSNLKTLADISNSVISVFDVHKKEHVFYSPNLGVTLGYTLQEIETNGQHFLDSKIHPDDFVMLTHHAFSIFELFSHLPKKEKLNYKLISEYRILDAANTYVRVIEQQQVLALDSEGNLWLALSILDISPNQKKMNEGLKSELLNFRTGKIIPLTSDETNLIASLTNREIEVLKLVREGFLSKEISEKLGISPHTVNTYRQKILKKLGVNNSMEAVLSASKSGLI